MNIPFAEFFAPADSDKEHARKLRRWDALSESDQRFALGVMLYENLVRLTPLSVSFSRAVQREQEAEERERKEAEEQALIARLERLTPNKPVSNLPGPHPTLPERANGQVPPELEEPPIEAEEADEDVTDADTVDNPIEDDES